MLVSRPCDSDPLDACIPQRLHRTCVLLWRFPKLDVPFAVHARQSASNVSSHARVVRWRMRTHFVGIWRGSLVGSVDIVVAGCKVFKASTYGLRFPPLSKSGVDHAQSALAKLLPEAAKFGCEIGWQFEQVDTCQYLHNSTNYNIHIPMLDINIVS
jgi:hypothetical protein